jgi:hypothetical protein
VEVIPIKVREWDLTNQLDVLLYILHYLQGNRLKMSGEGSSSNQNEVLQTQYTPEEIATFNKELDGKTPQEILVWAIDHLDGLYQTTAFGL